MDRYLKVVVVSAFNAHRHCFAIMMFYDLNGTFKCHVYGIDLSIGIKDRFSCFQSKCFCKIFSVFFQKSQIFAKDLCSFSNNNSVPYFLCCNCIFDRFVHIFFRCTWNSIQETSIVRICNIYCLFVGCIYPASTDQHFHDRYLLFFFLVQCCFSDCLEKCQFMFYNLLHSLNTRWLKDVWLS